MQINSIDNNQNFGLKIGPNIRDLLSTARAQAYRSNSELQNKTLANINSILNANHNYRLTTYLTQDANHVDKYSYMICKDIYHSKMAKEILNIDSKTPVIEIVNKLAEAVKNFFQNL